MKKISLIIFAIIFLFASITYAGFRSTDGSYSGSDTVTIAQYSDNLTTAI